MTEMCLPGVTRYGTRKIRPYLLGSPKIGMIFRVIQIIYEHIDLDYDCVLDLRS